MLDEFWDNVLSFKKRYDQALDPVAQACGLTRMELDLLLFLHNNPERATAAEAVRLRRWTKSHVSAAVHGLEGKGLLAVSHPPGNRKTLRLVPLPAAEGAIRQGAAAQARFTALLGRDITAEERAVMERVARKIARSLQETERK